MSAPWVDKDDNPGMAEWDLHSADAYSAVIAVSFADMLLRAAGSANFERWHAVGLLDDLAALAA